jgi:hypothetical protein
MDSIKARTEHRTRRAQHRSHGGSHGPCPKG